MTKMTYKNALEIAIANVENEEVKEKLKALQESISKKSIRSGERKPTKVQIENESLKAEILEFMNAEQKYTASEIYKGMGEEKISSNQKASALLNQLVKSGMVVRTTEKGKTYFSLV